MMLARKPKLLHEFEMETRINDEGTVVGMQGRSF